MIEKKQWKKITKTHVHPILSIDPTSRIHQNMRVKICVDIFSIYYFSGTFLHFILLFEHFCCVILRGFRTNFKGFREKVKRLKMIALVPLVRWKLFICLKLGHQIFNKKFYRLWAELTVIHIIGEYIYQPWKFHNHIDGLVQEKRNSSALAM